MSATAHSTNPSSFKQLILIPAAYPLIALLVMWAVQVGADEFGISLSRFGVKPRDFQGLLGIFSMPFVHGSYEHLSNNSMPVLVLGWALFKFYPGVAWRALLGIWFIGGLWLWISGRDAYHIGASGVVYGLATFLFLSGWLRREKGVAALSLVIVFVYGGLWWGVLPVNPQMSWEGHLWGGLAGFAMAWYLRKQGPQRPLYQWEKDEIEEQKRAAMIAEVIDTITFQVLGDESPQAQISQANTHPEVDKKKPDESQKPSSGNLNSSQNVGFRYSYKPSTKKEGENSDNNA
jgi:membrane associated rhomboid family serine protease